MSFGLYRCIGLVSLLLRHAIAEASCGSGDDECGVAHGSALLQINGKRVKNIVVNEGDFGVDVEFGTEIMNAWSVPPVCSDQYDMCLMMRQEIFKKDPTVYEELISIHRRPRSQTSDIYSENAESMARAISGKLGIDVKYKFFELSGLAELKMRSSKKKKAISLDRTVRFVQERVSLRKTRLSKYLTADARHALETWTPETICERIGDFYATNLDIGGWYTRSVRVKVSEEQESLDIHGKLTAKFDAVVTTIKGEAELEFSEGSQKSSIQAVTYVTAAGGDPSSLNGQMGGDSLDSAATKWADSIDLTKNPEAPLTTMNYRVRPLWEIVDEFDAAKGKKMRDYYSKKWEGNAQMMKQFENSFKHPTAAPTPGSSQACFLDGTDYYGNDLLPWVTGVSSAAECQAKCQAVLTCTFFTWKSHDQYCYLKTSDEGKAQHSGSVSGPRECCRCQ